MGRSLSVGILSPDRSFFGLEQSFERGRIYGVCPIRCRLSQAHNFRRSDFRHACLIMPVFDSAGVVGPSLLAQLGMIAYAMNDELDRQFRLIRHELNKQAVAVLFAANAGVGAAIVQWLLRTESDSTVLRMLALAAAASHGVGAVLAIRFPETWQVQFWLDQKAGKAEDPLTSAPLRSLQWSGRWFIFGIALLGTGLLFRELVRISGY